VVGVQTTLFKDQTIDKKVLSNMSVDQYSKFDITIIGAGPCGTILAYELAKRGVKVLILEKEKLPRAKVCAGGITVRAASLIPFDFSEVIEGVIYGSRLSYNLRPRIVRKYPQPLAYMVTREKFDYWLAGQARAAGVTLAEETPVERVEVQSQGVQVTLNAGTFETPLLVGADGANSVVVKSLGVRKNFEYGLGLKSLIPAGDKVLKDWEGLIGLDWGLPGGYAWVFPKQGLLSVGAGASYKVALRLKPYTERLINAYRLGEGRDPVIRGHLLPLRRANHAISFQRILLVGDAAGMIDPLTGEGIYYGLRSVYLALDALLAFLNGETTDLKEYEIAVDREIMPELKIARKVQKLNSFTPLIFFTLLKDRDRFWRAFCRMLRGEKTYAGLRRSLPQPFRFIFDRI
jgi:geranylgeranyl reductase family protein